MAQTLKITDGSTNISLLDASGFKVEDGGLGGLTFDSDAVNLDAGAGTKVVENYNLIDKASSHDNAAAQMQGLTKLLRKARQFWKTNWQTAPVWIQEQTKNETGARYALVFDTQSLSRPNILTRIFDNANFLKDLGVNIVREHPWRGSVPGTLPTALTLTKTSGSADAAEVHLSNLGSTGTGDAVSHIYNYDASSAAFSANLVAATSISLWAGTTPPPAAGDIMYFGFATRPGFNVVIPIATAGVFSADIIVEAWTGSWTALTLGTDFWFYPVLTSADQDNMYKTTGENVLSFAPGAAWTTTAINAVTAYWVRLRLNSVASWATQPVSHASQTPYTQRRNYFDASASVIGGDAPPRLMPRVKAPTSGVVVTPNANRISALFCGAKAGTAFESILNLHQYELPSGWAVAMGTDTSEEADTRVPSARRAACTFATATAMTARVTLTGTTKWADFVGTYRVLLLCEQTTGAAGDTQVKARFLQGGSGATNPYLDSKTVKLQGVALGYELVDLGNMSVSPDVVSADTLTDDLVVQVFAQRISGSASVRFSRIVLIPVDVFFFKAWMDNANGTLHLLSDEALDVDFGVLSDRTQKYRRSGSNYVPGPKWFRSASIRRVEPATQYRFHCLMGHYSTTFGTAPLLVSAGSHLALSLYAVPSYLALRGAG